MSENRHLISDASKKLGIEPHVLRYWEEELSLTIHRNEMGHRYYTDTDIRVLQNVHELKDQGFQLKALKMIIPEMYANQSFDLNRMISHKDELNAQAEQDTVEEASKQKSTENKGSGQAAFGADLKTGAMAAGSKGDAKTAKQAGYARETAVSTKGSADILSNENKLAQFQEIMNRAVSKALADQQQAIGEAVGVRMSEEVSDRVSDKVLKQMDYLMRESDDHAEERFKKLDETIREVQKARMEAAATNSSGKKKKGLFQKKEKKHKKQ